jgi:CO dehydrogenase maturation factor
LSHSIAVAGKGGTGKTSLTSLMIRYLLNNTSGPILAVDADANANLGEGLGLAPDYTLGMLLDDFKLEKLTIPAGLSKEAYLEMKMNAALLEGKQMDLLTMGHGEGPDCYCYPNAMLRKFQETLARNYDYVVIDNEAGMEHLSRRTTQDIDDLLLVSDHSVKGARTLGRIRELVAQLKLNVKRQWVVVNQIPGEMNPAVRAELEKIGITEIIEIPRDEQIYQADLDQKPLTELGDDDAAVKAVNDLMRQILN